MYPEHKTSGRFIFDEVHEKHNNIHFEISNSQSKASEYYQWLFEYYLTGFMITPSFLRSNYYNHIFALLGCISISERKDSESKPTMCQ